MKSHGMSKLEDAMHAAGDEDQAGSDEGASNDDQVYEAYMAMNKSRSGYQEARKKLREVQKSRGFYKNSFNEDRQHLINREKSKRPLSGLSQSWPLGR